MSLVESFLEGKEMRKAGKSVAQIERESKQDMRDLQRDQFNYRKKNDEIQRKVNQAKNVFEYQILPVVESMQKNNATPEQYAALNSKIKSEYGEVLTQIFGKNQNGELNFDIGYSPIKKQPTGSSMMMLNKESLEKYVSSDSPLHSILSEKIERNGGQAPFKAEYTEDGRFDLSSIGVNEYADIFKKLGLDVNEEEDFNKNKEMVDAILGIQKKVDQKTLKNNNDKPKNNKGWIEKTIEFFSSINNPSVSNETKVTTKNDKEIVKPVDNKTIVDNTKYNSQKEAEAQAKKTGVYGVYLYKNPEGRIVKGLIRNKTQ